MGNLLFDIGSLVLKTKGFVPPHLFFFGCWCAENFVGNFVELIRDTVSSLFLGTNQLIVVGLCGRRFLIRFSTEVFEKFRFFSKGRGSRFSVSRNMLLL